MAKQRLLHCVGVVACMTALATGCGESPTSATGPDAPVPTPRPETPGPVPTEAEPTPGPEAQFEARGGVEYAYVVDAEPGDELRLVDAGGATIETGVADEMGSLIYTDVAVAEGYRVETGSGAELRSSAAFDVKSIEDVPDQEFYSSQEIGPGYGYLETRDGTLLAINVLLPGPPEDGPYPTLIEYSGYDPANPNGSQPSILIGQVLGYAMVGINMRGSGCSGGVFDLFDLPTTADGYDAVETIAAQPWVAHGKVGMVGLSFPGISQVFVAGAAPPSLAAIAPLSIIPDIYRSPGYPGGIFNNGFAESWLRDRQRDAMPAPEGGQGWARERVEEGDTTCLENQKLRLQTEDIMATVEETPFYTPAQMDDRSPDQWVGKIEVPVFLSGAWQDEQTGSYFANILQGFDRTDKVRFTVVNGIHPEPLGPEISPRWFEFLDLYVGQRIPRRTGVEGLILSTVGDAVFRLSDLPIEEPRYGGVSTYEEALAQWEAEKPVRVIFENGAGTETPGAPYGTFELSFEQWPPEDVVAQAWYFGEDGSLSEDPPQNTEAETDRYRYDTSFAQTTSLASGSSWEAQPGYDWPYRDEDTVLEFTSSRLAEPLVLAGSASVDLWLRASATDVDIQATLVEVHPDGSETYVQNGWLRASHRAIDPTMSTDLRPVQTHFEGDAADLPQGEFTELRIEIFPFAHVFRKDSRVRLYIETPGGTRTEWRYDTLEFDEDVFVTVARSAEMASRIVLPVLPGVEVPPGAPRCGALRGQPCRGRASVAD